MNNTPRADNCERGTAAARQRIAAAADSSGEGSSAGSSGEGGEQRRRRAAAAQTAAAYCLLAADSICRSLKDLLPLQRLSAGFAAYHPSSKIKTLQSSAADL